VSEETGIRTADMDEEIRSIEQRRRELVEQRDTELQLRDQAIEETDRRLGILREEQRRRTALAAATALTGAAQRLDAALEPFLATLAEFRATATDTEREFSRWAVKIDPARLTRVLLWRAKAELAPELGAFFSTRERISVEQLVDLVFGTTVQRLTAEEAARDGRA
jgi:hypothetical protein